MSEEELRALGDPEFPGIERLPIRPWRSVAWYVREFTEITAAGTVADSHGVPFSSGTRNLYRKPQLRQIYALFL